MSILAFVMTIAVPTAILVNIDDVKWYHYLLVGIVMIVLFTSTVCIADEAADCNRPKAIDVYRGQTTLQITYIDSIPQDTIVIFK